MIAISHLNLTGSDLFTDSETYLRELTDSEMTLSKGGSSGVCATFVATAIVGSAAIIAQVIYNENVAAQERAKCEAANGSPCQ